ncbi:hypothetical protein KY290_033671 [Solanum tuberosum]|uniref:Uncharacterized protein n=1 Tax=Solanum tuberosum TaxID=4113 RepID=A0ABQ7U2S6_SOLTU|nr:hypothetical protein KY289_033041 [Solanum tuberosum]KAH0647685.1 hypothetical protein KY285_032933 [Solanum tuberosum]KAH0740628.1 hypothetical protein KY290_033671 [Solanum tuberosum]
MPRGFKVDIIVSGKAGKSGANNFILKCLVIENQENVELFLDFLLGNAKEKLLFCWSAICNLQSGTAALCNLELLASSIIAAI